jgi:two-component system nitrogen regulation sensor histidine kinase NtrY
MMNWIANSLERYLIGSLVVVMILIIGLWGVILGYAQFPPWDISVILGLSTAVISVVMVKFYHKIMATYDRGLLHIESMRVEDYNQYARASFSHGQVALFHQQLKELSIHLSNQKSRYDQHAFLVYQLIDQLNTPILVFNQKNQLSYGNGAFTRLYDQPWQMFRHASPKLLGLERQNHHWKFKDKTSTWQISQSEFIDDGETHQLLVFTNIELAMRASQQTAWHQIIRVMGHEIRNSLTPVSSLAEGLAVRAQNDRDKNALALISERCHHLQDFVSRYASLSQQFNLNPTQVNVTSLCERLSGLFNSNILTYQQSTDWIWADHPFLEQVLINLMKNSLEANATSLVLSITEKHQKTQIKITDNGHGFANLDNLFVPLFTTKTQGQGIGLSFCRNIIEQHNGTIKLENRKDAQGVLIEICLPTQSR